MNVKKALILALLTALICWLVLFDFIIAQGHSMEPAIKNGDILIISRCWYGIRLPWQQKYLIRRAQPKVGEIVVFYTPAEEIAVKRCAALTEGYRFYAEGDHSLASFDSRSYGAVPVDNIIGKVLIK